MKIKMHKNSLFPEDIYSQDLESHADETDFGFLPKPDLLIVSCHNNYKYFVDAKKAIERRKIPKDTVVIFTGVKRNETMERKKLKEILGIKLTDIQWNYYPFKTIEKKYTKIKNFAYYDKVKNHIFILPDICRGAYSDEENGKNLIHIFERILIEIEILEKEWRDDLKALIEKERERRRQIELEEKKKAFDRVFKEIIKAKAKTFTDRIAYLQNSITDKRRLSETKLDESIMAAISVETLQPELDALENWRKEKMDNFSLADFKKSFANLKNLKELSGGKFEFNENSNKLFLILHTVSLKIRNEITDKLSTVGSYEIKIPIPTKQITKVRFRKLDILKPTGAFTNIHPHIKADGLPCFGRNIPDTLKDAIVRDDYNLIACIFVDYLSSYNEKDSYTKMPIFLPAYKAQLKRLKDADKKEIEKGILTDFKGIDFFLDGGKK